MHNIRDRMARLSDALNRAFEVDAGTSGAHPSEASWRARARDLEAKLAAANAEIERLRDRLGEATRKPTSFAQMRAQELASMRQRRLWIARGGDRQL